MARARAVSMSVRAAVKRDLAALGVRELETGALAATALELAAQMDDRKNSATSKSMCAKALADVLERLRELAPARVPDSQLSRIRGRRDERVAEAGRAAKVAKGKRSSSSRGVG